MKRRGFTLIELLVVVAIIAILAAILFPVFAQAREKAKTASCSSNMAQVAKGLQMYQSDYDEHLCPVRVWGTGGVGNDTYPAMRSGVWHHLIQPYVKNEKILACPSMTVTEAPYPDFAATYGLNYRMTQFRTTPNIDDAPTLWFGTISTSQLKRPAETIWFCDTAWVNNPTVRPVHNEDPTLWQLQLGSWNYSGYVRFPQDPNGQMNGGGNYVDIYNSSPWRPAPVHAGGTNVTFADGHVKWYKTQALVNPARGSVDCLYDNGP